ncbi:MAG: alpha/beta hydrolase [Flavobacteriales bacterium]|nr:alpha/beta hydrolase [Flavobacteriales bacterium]
MGANSKVFERLDLSTYNLNFIDWLIPLNNEKIEDYAQRMAKDIDRSKTVILIGMSFGGIMVQEIAKFVKTEKIIIISSIKDKNELPLSYNISASLNLHKLIPSFLFHNTKLLGKVLFGKNKESTLKVMERYFTMKDIRYSRWAINEIVNWKGPQQKNNILHVHGTKDTIFPAKYITNATFVKNGTHLMIFNKANIVNKHFTDFLSKE